ncbi:MAG: biotin synthase BioB [Desulfobacterota bacterium]|nr:biotin synthase BioB [Thermodesulfobacteriota bacterium]
MTADHIGTCAEKVIAGRNLSRKEIHRLAENDTPEQIMALIFRADRVRRHFKGDEIDLCAIVNAKSGRCSEDCRFCAQSAHHPTRIAKYPLLPEQELLAAAEKAGASGAGRFSLVTSGRSLLKTAELERICRVIAALGEQKKLSPCASLGLLSREQARALKGAGLARYHHNLETGPGFYSAICSTHTFADRVRTLEIARDQGFSLCSGGIFGLGETLQDRIELALVLKKLRVDSVPLNFLNPIPQTPLAHQPPLPPLEILKSIALFRFILPKADIRSCGGREQALRTLQPLMYLAGCNGTMIGNYLTTAGRSPAEDVQEILDLGLKPRREGGGRKTEDSGRRTEKTRKPGIPAAL